MTRMGPGWVKAWSGTVHPEDGVYHHKEKNQIRFDFGEKLCENHDLGTFCAGCLARVEILLRAANHIVANSPT